MFNTTHCSFSQPPHHPSAASFSSGGYEPTPQGQPGEEEVEVEEVKEDMFMDPESKEMEGAQKPVTALGGFSDLFREINRKAAVAGG